MFTVVVVVPPFSIQFSTEALKDILPGIAVPFASLTFRLQKLEDKVYVMYEASNRIHVYDISNPFYILEEFFVKELKSPYDVAACSTSNCLYVSDLESLCIWKIAPSDRQATLWSSVIGKPYTISVLSDGRVIIPRDGKPSSVEIYTSDAVLIEVAWLPEEIQHPMRVVETPTGSFIVLHRCINTSSVVLSVVAKNGNTVNRFTSGDKGVLLSDGCGLSIMVDEDDIDDFAVVATDCDNSKIIVFDSELKTLSFVNSDGTTDIDDNSDTEQ